MNAPTSPCVRTGRISTPTLTSRSTLYADHRRRPPPDARAASSPTACASRGRLNRRGLRPHRVAPAGSRPQLCLLLAAPTVSSPPIRAIRAFRRRATELCHGTNAGLRPPSAEPRPPPPVSGSVEGRDGGSGDCPCCVKAAVCPSSPLSTASSADRKPRSAGRGSRNRVRRGESRRGLGPACQDHRRPSSRRPIQILGVRVRVGRAEHAL